MGGEKGEGELDCHLYLFATFLHIVYLTKYFLVYS